MAAGGGQHRRHNRCHHPVHDWSASSWPETRISVGLGGGDDGYGGGLWPPRKYACSFCRREFRSAQALGGHMNVHRRDRARLRQASPPTTSSSSSATNSATADPQEYHPLINISSAPLPCPPLASKISSEEPSTSLNSCNPCGPALSFSRLTALSPVSNLEVVRPEQFSKHDYAGRQSTVASYSSSARPTICLPLMCSSPAVIDPVLQSTRQISFPDDHIGSSTSSTAANGDHHHRRHYLESDIAAEDLQPPSVIASCGPYRSSLITSLKREIQSRPSKGSSSGMQPSCHNYSYTTAHKDYDDIVQHVNGAHDSLIISSAAGLDLELRLGRKLS